MPKKKLLPSLSAYVIVGMLESSAMLDEKASEMRKLESRHGQSQGVQTVSGVTAEVIALPLSHSLGVTVSAQVLAGQATELSLKLLYEEKTHKLASQNHDLYSEWNRLPSNVKQQVQQNYEVRIKRHMPLNQPKWSQLSELLISCRRYSIDWRYITEDDPQRHMDSSPILLREGVCSMMGILGYNINWSGGV